MATRLMVKQGEHTFALNYREALKVWVEDDSPDKGVVLGITPQEIIAEAYIRNNKEQRPEVVNVNTLRFTVAQQDKLKRLLEIIK